MVVLPVVPLVVVGAVVLLPVVGVVVVPVWYVKEKMCGVVCVWCHVVLQCCNVTKSCTEK